MPGSRKDAQGPAGRPAGGGRQRVAQGEPEAPVQWPTSKARSRLCLDGVQSEGGGQSSWGQVPTCPDPHCVLGTNLGWPDCYLGWRLTARAV